MELRFNEASRVVAIDLLSNPSNRFPLYLKTQAAFIKAFVSEEPAHVQIFKTIAESSISQLLNENKVSLLRGFALGEIYFMTAVIQFREGEFVKGAWNLRKGYLLLNETRARNPLFLPVYKTLGLLHAVIGTIPDEYVWIAEIVGVRGSLTQGRNELISLVKASFKYPELKWIQTESLLFLFLVEMNLQNNQNSAGYILSCIANTGKELYSSQILTYIKAGVEMHMGKNDNAISTLFALKMPDDAYKIYYLDYLKGITLLQKLDKGCNAYFFSFIGNYNGTSYKKSAYQKLGWYFLLEGNLDKYYEYLSKAKLYGSTFTDPDKMANKEATEGPVPEPVLLRARLLSDGGYWTSALAALNAGDFDSASASKRNQLEYTYRLARIFDEMDSISLAEFYYKRVIDFGSCQPYYFAANSCIMLARLYENMGMNAEALYYYKKCKDLEFDEYYNSIIQKAKAGIAKLE